MFKWPYGVPSTQAPGHELADFIELIAWQRASVSAADVAHLLGRLDDNDYFSGVPIDDDVDRVVEDAYNEIEWRASICGDGYPFVVGAKGQTLRLARTATSNRHVIYQYLLLATRLNMGTNRSHENIDGALLFEELSAEIARNYLGPNAETLVFGTAAGQNGFPEKINDLCHRLREGDGFMDRDVAGTRAQDGKLDVVIWKPFGDGAPGQLIAFGQCKTGTEYRDSLTQLRPDSFCSKWLSSSPAVNPVRMFFVCDSPGRGNWYSMSTDAGILFDRCRVIDFCGEISDGVRGKLLTWTSAAAVATGLPTPQGRQSQTRITLRHLP